MHRLKPSHSNRPKPQNHRRGGLCASRKTSPPEGDEPQRDKSVPPVSSDFPLRRDGPVKSPDGALRDALDVARKGARGAVSSRTASGDVSPDDLAWQGLPARPRPASRVPAGAGRGLGHLPPPLAVSPAVGTAWAVHPTLPGPSVLRGSCLGRQRVPGHPSPALSSLRLPTARRPCDSHT